MVNGDILIFKGAGPIFQVLSRILKLFERDWDRWGWHAGFIVNHNNVWHVCESIARGICLTPLENFNQEIRVYRWFDVPPSEQKVGEYLASHLGKRYDVAIYFWTGLQYLFRHFWNRRIPRLLDDRYTCWENVSQFCDFIGKPLHNEYDCPMLPDMLRKIESYQIS